MCERFQHFLETISKHMKHVAKALTKLAPELITTPNFQTTHTKILNDSSLYLYFKNCVGAIDGTFMAVWVPQSKQNTYHNRKRDLTQNVMAVCDFNLMFTYVLTGWKGSTNDSPVLMDALNKYYLVDFGYCNFPSFLAPYLQHRCHINSWTDAYREPRGPQEFFNKQHLRFRKTIERTFRVLKGRFPILKGPMPHYSLRHQVQIIIACCIIHNWLRKYSANDQYFIHVENGEFDPQGVDKEHRDYFPHASQEDKMLNLHFVMHWQPQCGQSAHVAAFYSMLCI
ncbi:hypothetical protein Pfo_003536 [Paulownia fortunei]|nr:hypothetical protein Pfo_003536 [Paulownia fortunei]